MASVSTAVLPLSVDSLALSPSDSARECLLLLSCLSRLRHCNLGPNFGIGCVDLGFRVAGFW